MSPAAVVPPRQWAPGNLVLALLALPPLLCLPAVSSPLGFSVAALLALVICAACLDSLTPYYHKASPTDFAHARTRMPGDELPPPYPDGWYAVLFSWECRPGQVVPVRALGREFAVWRSAQGVVSVMGAYCPHLGANLAVGGCVESDCLRCPFHGWGFNLDGTVRDVQGCKEHVPQKTRAETYVCVERNEMILLWLGGEADAPRRGRGAGKAAVADVPEWEVPVEACVQEYQFVGLVEHSVQAHVQEIPENGADGAHLLTVHAPFVVSQLTGWLDHDWNFTWTPGATEQDKHTAVVGMKLGMRVFGTLFDSLTVRLHVTQVGPGLVHEYLHLPFGLGTLYFASTVTPVKPLLQRYTHVMWGPKWLPRFVPKLLLRGLLVQVNRDIPIWNNKYYRTRPPYSVADKNIPKFRRWFAQFYSPHSESFQEACAAEQAKVEMEW